MAAKEMVWNFEVQGIPYRVELKKNAISVNGAEPVKLNKLAKKSSLTETHYSMMIEGKEAILHVRQFGAVVLSYDGRDCATGEEYIPAKMPGWAWVFIVLHAIDFFFLIGGAVGGILQVFIVTAIAAVSSNRKKSTGVRVLVCIGIWLLSTIAQFILAVGIASLMY
ncbi:MAG: hypothetical protein HFI57_14940 [Lachnospiraceae bacterium]|nr:hypothetical protein [Lachnospiraceae bacterium]